MLLEEITGSIFKNNIKTMNTMDLQLQLLNLMQERQTRLWDISFKLCLDQEPGYLTRNIMEISEIVYDNDSTDCEILKHFNLWTD